MKVLDQEVIKLICIFRKINLAAGRQRVVQQCRLERLRFWLTVPAMEKEQ